MVCWCGARSGWVKSCLARQGKAFSWRGPVHVGGVLWSGALSGKVRFYCGLERSCLVLRGSLGHCTLR